MSGVPAEVVDLRFEDMFYEKGEFLSSQPAEMPTQERGGAETPEGAAGLSLPFHAPASGGIAF